MKAAWRAQRLQPQLDLARRNGYSVDAGDIWRILQGHEPRPALLHGDLWHGNAGFSVEGPVLLDPAVYCGDPEADLAMTELFGGFPAEFYAAYCKTQPLPAGYQRRKWLYNAYHLLNHLNLFGSSYLEQVEAELRFLRHAL